MDQSRIVERLLVAQAAVADALATASGLGEAATSVLSAIGEACEWTSGEFWSRDDDVSELVVRARWSRSGFVTVDGDAAIIAARALATGQFAQDNESPSRHLGVPISTRSGPRGALTFARSESGTAFDLAFTTIRSAASQFGTFIDYTIAASALDELGAHVHGGSVRDTSDRKRSEAENETMRALIEKSAREWQRTLDVISFPILLLDGDARILRLNRSARDLLMAATYVDVLGLCLDDVSGSEPWATATQLVRSMAGEPAGSSRSINVVASRMAWDVEATVSAPADVGEARIVLLVRDVTSTARLQESLRRTETMAAIGVVVASVAHEVRTPLFSIGATVDAFEAEFVEHQEEFAEYHGVLRRQVDRLSKLMEDLLEYGKPLTIAPAAESIAELVAVAVDLCAATAAHRHVHVGVRLNEALPWAHVDRARCIQVLQNLIENAIEHSPVDATVEIVVSALGRSDGDWIVCRVLDSGPGFVEGDLGRVFEPFFTKRPGGTGLGLSIVQRIVDQHGGAVYAENRSRGGACLTVLFPQEPEREGTTWPSTES